MPKPRLSTIGSVLQLDLTPGVEYRSIPEFQNYAVGSDGSVWSRKTRGPQINFGPWRLLKQYEDEDQGRGNLPYFRVGLSNIRVYFYRVHTLVLTVFKGPSPSPELIARHENGNCQDNRASNLFWGTRIENAADKLRHGTDQRGERSRSHLTENDVRRIRSLEGVQTAKNVAAAYGVNPGCIYGIWRRRRWWYLE